MMWRSGLFRCGWLRSADDELTINRHRIAIYDLASEMLREHDGQLRLAAASRTENRNQQRIAAQFSVRSN